MRYFLAYIVLALLCTNSVFAQQVNPSLQPSFVNYTIEDGLPSNEVYDVVQDHLGYLWFATDNGVCRYDGYVFKIFNTANGLTDNAVFKFHVDHKNRVWCATSNNVLCYIQNDSVFEYQYNHILADHLPMRAINTSLVVDEDETVHLGFSRTGYYRIDSSGSLLRYGETNRFRESHTGRVVLRLSPTTLSTFCFTDIRTGEKEPDSTYFKFLDPDDLDDTSSYKPLYKKSLPNNETAYGTESSLNYATHVGRDSIIAFSYSKGIHYIYPDTTFIRSLGGNDIGILATSNSFWLGKRNAGAFEFKLDGATTPLQHVLPDYSVSSICVDHENGFWFSTLESGIFYTPNISIRSIHTAKVLSNLNGFTFGKNTSELFLSYDNGDVLQVEVNKRVKTLKKQPSPYAASLQYRNNILSVFTLDSYMLKEGALYDLNPDPHFRMVDGFYHSKTGVFMGHNLTYFIEVDGTDSSYTPKDCKVIDIAEYKQGMLVAASEGLFFVKHGKVEELPTSQLFPNFGSPTALTTYNDIAFIATSNGTIYRLVNGKIMPFWNHKITNSITSLATNGKWLYVGSKMGIYRTPTFLLSNANATNGRQSSGSIWDPAYVQDSIGVINDLHAMDLERISLSNGLPTNQVLDIRLQDDTLWTTTTRGITAIRLESFSQHSYPHLYLDQVKVNDVSITPADTIRLKADQNRLEFIFGGISFKQTGIVYRYQLVGEDPTPIETGERIARYTSLAPDSYTFTVAASSDGVKFCEVLSCTVIIEPPFWQNTWFLILCFAIIVMLIYLIIRWRIRIASRKDDIQRQLLELRSSALRAQMNPHFTFNALNSIQRLVASNENEKASIYLAEFSGLMRKALNASSQSVISLRDEIDIVKNYLLMEKLRFKEKFEYELEVASTLDLDSINVPPMIMQPFVENAIIHGLLPKKAAGRIMISVQHLNPTQLQIIVEDDGIGYDVSIRQTKIKSSKGVEITRSRIELIHSDNAVRIETLKDENNESCGTRIEIILNDNL